MVIESVIQDQPSNQLSGSIAYVAVPDDIRIRHIYNKVIEPELRKSGFECQSSATLRADESVDLDIGRAVELIQKAVLFVCDLTSSLPAPEGERTPVNGCNDIFYQLGIAHALKKPIIIISQTSANLNFNIREWLIIQYEDTNVGLVELQEMLGKWLDRFPQNTMHPENSLDEMTIQRRNLYANSPFTKRFAIKYLGEFEDAQSFPIIEQIITPAYREDWYDHTISNIDQETLRDAFTALFKIAPKSAYPFLINGLQPPGLRGDYYLVRERIVNLLGSNAYPLPTKDLLNLMIAELKDTSWGVRQAVCKVLGKWGKSKALDSLGEILLDPQLQVRMAAAEAFERLNEIKAKKEQENIAEDLKLSNEQVVALANKIYSDFNLDELENLCFLIEVDFDDLAGTGKKGKGRELITYCQRHGKVSELIQMIDTVRPQKTPFLQKIQSITNPEG